MYWLQNLNSHSLLMYAYLSRDMTKPTKWHVRSAKTQFSLGIRPVWSESSLSAWRKLGSLATHWADSEDSDQIGRMPRLIWVFAGRTVILLVLSWGGSFLFLIWSKLILWSYLCLVLIIILSERFKSTTCTQYILILNHTLNRLCPFLKTDIKR